MPVAHRCHQSMIVHDVGDDIFDHFNHIGCEHILGSEDCLDLVEDDLGLFRCSVRQDGLPPLLVEGRSRHS
jgi:hypothetical protein